MHALVRIALLVTLAVVALFAVVFIVKLVFAAAVLAFVALAAMYLFNLGRAFVRRLAAKSAAGPIATLRP